MSDRSRSSTSTSTRGVLRRLVDDERVRFVLVGIVNTVVGYGLFVLFELGLGNRTHYLVSLYLSYALGTLFAFVLHRRVTFRLAGRSSLVRDYLRFCSVYLVSLALNTALLPLLVEVGGLSTLLAQGIIVAVTTVLSYLGHKFFSFRRTAHSRKS